MNELQQRFLELTDNKKLRDVVCSLSNYPPGCLAQAGELWNDFATNNHAKPAKPEDIVSFVAWCPVHRRPLDRVELAKLIESNSYGGGALGTSPFNGFLTGHKTFGEIEARLFPFAPRRIRNLILCQACRESKQAWFAGMAKSNFQDFCEFSPSYLQQVKRCIAHYRRNIITNEELVLKVLENACSFFPADEQIISVGVSELEMSELPELIEPLRLLPLNSNHLWRCTSENFFAYRYLDYATNLLLKTIQKRLEAS